MPARVHFQDRLPPGAVRRLHEDAPVEAPGPEQSLVEHVRPIGRSDHDHARRRIEAVHLGQDLIQRLLALVVAAAEARDPGRPRAPDRVELVDEDDRRRSLLRLGEQVAHARGSDPDDRLHELRRGDREEGCICLSGNRAREQRLAGARRAGQEDAARNPATELAVLRRTAKEVDHFGQLVLGLVDPGDVLERHPVF
jgi:hypothetical protein